MQSLNLGFLGMLAFANHLLIKLNSEPQILERTFSNKGKFQKKYIKKSFSNHIK